MEKVQKVASGYVIPEETYSKICREMADTSAKLIFIKRSLSLMEEHMWKENEGIYGLDAIINDIITTCDNTYNQLSN